jgi:hypothetical protein
MSVIREIITRIVNEETGEVLKEISNFENGLLYGVYAVVSNKTVRANEKLLIRWYNNKKDVPGKEMIHTNRGWFLDGYQLDEKSTQKWFDMTGLSRSSANTKKRTQQRWNSKKKPVKKS